MSIKEKVKSYSFWVSLASAIVLILQVIGSKFGFYVDARLASDIITSACSVLVITGIIVTPTAKNGVVFETENTSNDNVESKPETISPDNSLKENISILADNLKDVADKVFEENLTAEEKVATQTFEKPEFEEVKIEILDISEPTTITVEDAAENKTETEAIIVEPNSVNAETIEENSTRETISNNTDDLKSVLTLQKAKYADNIEEYYQILLHELKSLRSHE